MDYITVGLDFGTHQTKICVQTVPDEGRGQPSYEFFTFEDLAGGSHYFLPSFVKIRPNRTLLYGYDEPQMDTKSDQSHRISTPLKKAKHVAIDVKDTAMTLFNKYVGREKFGKGFNALTRMLEIREKQIIDKEQKQIQAEEEALKEEEERRNARTEIFRYFKQATFSGAKWEHSIDYDTISIWYLSYILFLLEKKYGQNFGINMGVPADNENFLAKKKKAVEILLNAYHLVEDVYNNNLDAYLAETVEGLLSKTPDIKYTEALQEDYNLKVFPEAYAGLATLTAQRKLPNGMCMYVDIGGGTTDFSCFSIPKEGDVILTYPMIYRYWSINMGLNYLAEASGFDYADGDFADKVSSNVIFAFRQELKKNAANLELQLREQFKTNTDVDESFFTESISDSIVVYNGGGSTYPFLTYGIGNFKISRVIDSSLWKNISIANKKQVEKLCPLLTTAYGLSLSKNESDVKLTPFNKLFDGHQDGKSITRTQSSYDNSDNEDRTPRRKWL